MTNKLHFPHKLQANFFARTSAFKKIFEIFANADWKTFFGFIAFAAILFGVKLWLIGMYANATPYWDQWDAEAVKLYKPFLEGTLRWADLFAPHNEHRIFTTRILALFLLVINGIWNPLLQMVVNSILHILTIGLTVTLIARTIGRNHLAELFGFSLVILIIPYAWENTLAGFQSQFYFVVLFSISSMWFTITQSPLSKYWWGGVVCAVLAFLSLASGIFALASTVIIGLIIYGSGLRKTKSQLIAVAMLIGLFVAGVMLTPTIEGHAPLKATTFHQFYVALISNLAWPLSAHFYLSIIRNFPAIIFACMILWKRPPAEERQWFLLALVLWVLGQSVGIAYGRAMGSLSSRYLDLIAIGLVINFSCLILIIQNITDKWRILFIAVASLWIIIVLISLAEFSYKDLPSQLSFKHETGLQQELNTKNYLSTNNFIYLKDKPYLYVPYPSSEYLATILQTDIIRNILPSNIRPAMNVTFVSINPFSAFVSNGYFPATPKRSDPTLGSYGLQGDAAVGFAKITYGRNNQAAVLAIPVAGYPLNGGIKIEIEQSGKRTPLKIEKNPKESWQLIYVKVANVPFSIYLTDSSPTAWLAVGSPVLTGKFDNMTQHLIDSYSLFIMVGFAFGILLILQNSFKNNKSSL